MVGVVALLALAVALIWRGVAGAAHGPLDAAILRAFRSPADLAQPIGPVWLADMMRDFTALGSTGVLVLVTAGAVIYLAITRRWSMAAIALTAVLGGLMCSTALKLGIERPRPDIVPHATAVFTHSFPSGHATMSAVVYLTLGLLFAHTQGTRAAKLWFMFAAGVVTVLVGISRVYLGVHWPSDVLAGWALGAGWAVLSWLAMAWLQAAGTVGAAGDDG